MRCSPVRSTAARVRGWPQSLWGQRSGRMSVADNASALAAATTSARHSYAGEHHETRPVDDISKRCDPRVCRLSTAWPPRSVSIPWPYSRDITMPCRRRANRTPQMSEIRDDWTQGGPGRIVHPYRPSRAEPDRRRWIVGGPPVMGGPWANQGAADSQGRDCPDDRNARGRRGILSEGVGHVLTPVGSLGMRALPVTRPMTQVGRISQPANSPATGEGSGSTGD